MKIAVLLGGFSSERNVSLNSGLEIGKALTGNHEVFYCDPVISSGFSTVDRIASEIHNSPNLAQDPDTSLYLHAVQMFKKSGVEFVFNALHGGLGENGTVQAILDSAGLAYSGSGLTACAVTMNKTVAKHLMTIDSIPTPAYLCFGGGESTAEMMRKIADKFTPPLVVKPNEEGSTVGLTIVQEKNQLEDALNRAQVFGDVIVEEYIPGREITVAILGDEALPVIEIRPIGGFYDYEHKYTKGKTEYDVPAEIEPSVAEAARDYALRAFQICGCSVYGRVDFRLKNDTELFCLEINTLPGMTETSLVPKAAACSGISFKQLIERIVQLSLN